MNFSILEERGEIEKLSFKQVIFASRFDPEDQEPFLVFFEFITPFAPECIHLLSVNTGSWLRPPQDEVTKAMEDFKAIAAPLNCQCQYFSDYAVEAGIRHFAKRIGADLAVVSNANRHPIRRIFVGSNVEALVNHCDVPILSIDFPK